MLEKKIEKAVCTYAKSKGWLTFKWVSPGNAGAPDRLMIKGNQTIFIEFKSPSGRLSAVQKAQIKRLIYYGATVHVVNSIEQGKRIIDNAS